MKQSVVAGLSALLLAALLPMALLAPVEAVTPEASLVVIETSSRPQTGTMTTETVVVSQAEAETMAWDSTQEINLLTGDSVTTLPLSEYLTEVVLSEMPASFCVEALKAQAVAARTFTLRNLAAGKHDTADLCADSSCCQAWTSRQGLMEKLGDAFEAYWEKAAEAVAGTDGQVLTYDGALIDAVYFSCSGGTTEDAVAVWGGEVPYLQSVESPGEEISSKFTTEVNVSFQDFQTLLQATNPAVDLTGQPSGWFGAVSYTEGGGVATMEIGGQVFRGTQLRTCFGLNSAKFTVAVEADGICFTVSGYGHRVGMSQYGAEAMARAGSNYRDILLHYYSGVTLTTMTGSDT